MTDQEREKILHEQAKRDAQARAAAKAGRDGRRI